MIAPRMAGLRCCHSPARFVTEMKSWPNITPVTPSMENSARASGETPAESESVISNAPSARTVRPGRNFSVAGLGVDSVWMNMTRSGSRSGGYGGWRPAGFLSYRRAPRDSPPEGDLFRRII